MKEPVAVVIPVYQKQPSDTELMALAQCVSVLGQHPLVLVAPNSLEISVYQATCSGAKSFSVTRFDDRYFSSIEGYNQLLLSASFYQQFSNYQYILIHQLDAYVFKDDLIYWCNRGFAYIGAPHLPHENKAGDIQFLKKYRYILRLFNRKISHVGNGGFSLRHVAKTYRLLKILAPQAKKWLPNNEDGFFKYWGNILFLYYNLPTDEEALHFAIETPVAQSLQKINGLPFGCHAFEKYEKEVWENYMPL